jgi:CRP-like cAMP-binding protein
MFDQISKCPVLRGIEPGLLEIIFQDIHFNIKSFEKESVIANAGDICAHLMILLEGEVRGEMMNFSGNVVMIETISAPRPIAPAFLFGENNRFPVTVVANSKIRVIYIPRSEVLKLFLKNQTVLENYLNILCTRGQFLSRKVKLLSLDNLKQRIAFYLLEHRDAHNDKRTTQQELSEILGVTRPALTRSLLQLKKEKIIDYNRDSIRIIDKERLNRLLL